LVLALHTEGKLDVRTVQDVSLTIPVTVERSVVGESATEG
jgi:hypothetical protein